MHPHTSYGCLVTRLPGSSVECPERTLLLLGPLQLQVPEIIQFIYYNMNRITEATAQGTIKKTLYLLAQNYTAEVILTLLKMEDQSQR